MGELHKGIHIDTVNGDLIINEGDNKTNNEDPKKSFWQVLVSWVVKLLGLSQ